jgi:hypothetical protein
MGELFRSEEMQLVQLFMSLEAARDTVDELGEIGLIQFKDVREMPRYTTPTHTFFFRLPFFYVYSLRAMASQAPITNRLPLPRGS